MSQIALEGIYLAGLVAAELLRLPQRIRRIRAREAQRKPAGHQPAGERIVLVGLILGFWILPGGYIFTVTLRAFDYTLPAWTAWPAIAVFALGLVVRWMAHSTIGSAWSPTLETSDGHRLVTSGIYRHSRHPIYTSLIFWAIAQPVLLQNIIAGLGGVVAVALIWLLRVPAEEKMMIDKFGDEYVRYMERAGRVFPRPRLDMIRSRLWLYVSLVAVVALGIASRTFPSLFPSFFGKYPGDALWALMVFLGWGLVKPRASTRRLALMAFASSCLVEFSQLYQAPWINAVRASTMGHLVLGSTFSWFDIAAYAVGVLAGALVDALALAFLALVSQKQVGRSRVGE